MSEIERKKSRQEGGAVIKKRRREKKRDVVTNILAESAGSNLSQVLRPMRISSPSANKSPTRFRYFLPRILLSCC